MKTKIRSLVAFVLFSAASLTMLFGSPNTQPSGNPQTEPGRIIAGDSLERPRQRQACVLALTRIYLVHGTDAHIDLNQPSVTLEQVDARSLTLEAEPNRRQQKYRSLAEHARTEIR